MWGWLLLPLLLLLLLVLLLPLQSPLLLPQAVLSCSVTCLLWHSWLVFAIVTLAPRFFPCPGYVLSPCPFR